MVSELSSILYQIKNSTQSILGFEPSIHGTNCTCRSETTMKTILKEKNQKKMSERLTAVQVGTRNRSFVEYCFHYGPSKRPADGCQSSCLTGVLNVLCPSPCKLALDLCQGTTSFIAIISKQLSCLIWPKDLSFHTPVLFMFHISPMFTSYRKSVVCMHHQCLQISHDREERRVMLCAPGKRLKKKTICSFEQKSKKK